MKRDPFDAAPPRPVRAAKAKFREIAAICGKCARRQGLSKRALRDGLKAEMKRSRSGIRLLVVETGCLGPCPKRLIAVATGAGVAAGRILLIDPAAPAVEILAALIPDPTVAVRLPHAAGIGDGRDEPA